MYFFPMSSLSQAKGLRLCDAASATGTIKFYDSMKGFGYVIGKDGQETRVNHSQVRNPLRHRHPPGVMITSTRSGVIREDYAFSRIIRHISA